MNYLILISYSTMKDKVNDFTYFVFVFSFRNAFKCIKNALKVLSKFILKYI